MKSSSFLLLLLLIQFPLAGQNCLNADFESGLTNGYITYTGAIDSVGNVTIDKLELDPKRFKVMHISDGIDSIAANFCTLNDSLPMVSKDGGQYSLRLGNARPDAEAEKIVLNFTVTPELTFFLLKYAVVLNDPMHQPFEQPRFEMNILDELGNPVDCGIYKVRAAEFIPGFESCEGGWRIRPWTTVGFELQRFLGKTINIEILTTDCSQGAHAGYAYLDASCSPLEIKLEGYCPDSTTAQLRVTEGFIKYEWEADSTNTSNILHLVNPIPESVYTVTVTSGTGCTLVLKDTIPRLEEFPPPTFDAISHINICQGDSVIIQPNGLHLEEVINLNYNYSATSFVFAPIETTEYLFVSFNKHRCISDTLSVIVEVEPTIRSSFTTSADTYCFGDTVHLNYQSTGSNNYPFWFLEDSSFFSGEQPPPLIAIGPNSTMNITLIDSTICTIDTFSKQIAILDLPNSEMNMPPAVCVADTFLIEPMEQEVFKYQWRFNKGKISNASVLEFAYETAGLDTIFLLVTDTSSGCNNASFEVLNVHPLPSSNFEAIVIDTCPPAKLSLRTIAPINSTYDYQWQKDGFLFSTNNTPIETFEQEGIFLIKLTTNTNLGCSSVFEKNITIPSNPKAIITSSENTGCDYTGILLEGPTGKDPWTYQWRLSDGQIAMEQDPFFKLKEPGYIDIRLLVSNGACFDVADTTIAISVPPKHYVEILQNSQVIDQGENLSLPIHTSIESPILEWQPTTGLDCSDCPIPTANPLVSTQYVVSAKEEECIAYDSIHILVNRNRDIFIPTSFSPNNDGTNDLFYAMANNSGIKNIKSFRIFTRWGELCYEQFNFPISISNYGWDGSFKGRKAPNGVYVYQFEIEFIDGEQLLKSGEVTLVR